MCAQSSVVSDSCTPVDHSPLAPSVHGIFQASALKQVAISPPRDLPNSQGSNRVSLHFLCPGAGVGSLTTAPPENKCVCITRSFCCIAETNTSLVINCTSFFLKRRWKHQDSPRALTYRMLSVILLTLRFPSANGYAKANHFFKTFSVPASFFRLWIHCHCPSCEDSRLESSLIPFSYKFCSYLINYLICQFSNSTLWKCKYPLQHLLHS